MKENVSAITFRRALDASLSVNSFGILSRTTVQDAQSYTTNENAMTSF